MIRTIVVDSLFPIANEINYFKKHINDNISPLLSSLHFMDCGVASERAMKRARRQTRMSFYIAGIASREDDRSP